MLNALIKDFKKQTRLSDRIEYILCMIGFVVLIAVLINVIVPSYL